MFIDLLGPSIFVSAIEIPLRSSSCALCRFFAIMTSPAPPGEERDQGYQLRAYSALNSFGLEFVACGRENIDSVLLAVNPNSLSLLHMDSRAYKKELK